MQRRRDGIPTLRSGNANRLLGLMVPADVRNEMSSCLGYLLVINNSECNGALYVLPKGEKYNQLNSCDFEQRFMFGNLVFKLNIELDETIHGYCNTCSFDTHNLEVRQSSVQICGLMGHTQTCAKAGFSDSRQYRPVACVTTATSVMATRTKQYWKTPNQIICNDI